MPDSPRPIIRKTTLTQRALALIVLAAALLAGCGTSSRLQSLDGNKYRYSISMAAPERSGSLLYRDDRLIIQFRFDDPAIRFQAQNISAGGMTIDWPDVVLRIRDNRSAVRNLSVFYDTSGTLPKSISVPSLGVVRDVILPRENVAFDQKAWRVDDLLPTRDGNSRLLQDAIGKLVGSSIELTFPVRFGAEIRPYRFTFVVDSVLNIPWNASLLPAWFPPSPPVLALGPTSGEQIAAVVIIGGFAGMFSYMLSKKKSPVIE